MKLVCRIFFWVALVLLPIAAQAHEIGATRAKVTFRPEAYEVTIEVEPAAFVSRLETESGGEVSSLLTSPQRVARIQALQGTFLSAVEMMIDGKPVKPQFAYAEVPGKGATELERLENTTGEVRLSGTFPRGSSTFQWSYSFPYTRYALEVTAIDGSRRLIWLEGGDRSPVIPLGREPDADRLAVARQYLWLGFTHILPKGLDHILFVVGIFILLPKVRAVLSQVTAFTLAHSITLGLSMYGVLSLPSRVVEPLIALSIAYIAIENLWTSKIHPWRIALVFLFGLLHGLGFAGVLTELGIPRREFVTALIAFNVGVEAGQLAVIGICLLLVVAWARNRPWYRSRVVIPVSLVIGIVGIYWTIERVMG